MTANTQTPVRQTIDDLRKQFSVPGVSFEPGEGGLIRVAISTDAADAQVYLHGAHVTRFQPRGSADLLFVSSKSLFAAGKAIRGGIPIIFPWFGAKAGDPSAPAHGLARTHAWSLRSATAEGAGASRIVGLTFAMNADESTRAPWPHDFELLYTVKIGKELQLDLEVRNPAGAGQTFSFEEALHTYLSVGDVRQVKIEGLAGREFLDKPDGFKRKVQPPGAFGIDSETDRVYLGTPDTVTVSDPAKSRTLIVRKENSSATIVWNPWIAKAKSMSDFGDDEWPLMLCIETANVDAHAIRLAPGQSHVMRAFISDH